MNENKVRIFYATVSGTARLVAEAIALAHVTGVESVTDLEEAIGDGAWPPEDKPALLCISTTGAGDMPVSALNVCSALASQPRYLGAFRYGMIALGDSSYASTHCGGGLAFDAFLQDLGARRAGEILFLDAAETASPDEAAIEWFATWIGLVSN